MKSKFNWKLILQPNTVVHCDTMEKANVLLTGADERGRRWCNGATYANTQWNELRENTCYDLYDNMFGRLEYYKDKNYTILTYEDVLIKGVGNSSLIY